MNAKPYLWTGSIVRGSVSDTITGELRDPFGFSIAITGTKAEGGYTIVGTPGPVPEDLWLPGDEE